MLILNDRNYLDRLLRYEYGHILIIIVTRGGSTISPDNNRLIVWCCKVRSNGVFNKNLIFIYIYILILLLLLLIIIVFIIFFILIVAIVSFYSFILYSYLFNLYLLLLVLIVNL
jgi:hypothetical protein